jgi:hypothetical protein
MVHVTASMVHVTNLTPGGDNPSRVYGSKHGSVDDSRMVRVTNLTPPGSECNPTRGFDVKLFGAPWCEKCKEQKQMLYRMVGLVHWLNPAHL